MNIEFLVGAFVFVLIVAVEVAAALLLYKTRD